MKRRLSQVGDTIVEVLLSITIVGTVMTGAYVATTRSTAAQQQAQERSQALAVAQTQLEALRANQITNISYTFCMELSGSNYTPTPSGAFTVAQPGNNFSLYPAQCQFNNSGAAAVYYVYITQDAVSKTFTVTVLWNAVSGNSIDDIVMYYRTT